MKFVHKSGLIFLATCFWCSTALAVEFSIGSSLILNDPQSQQPVYIDAINSVTWDARQTITPGFHLTIASKLIKNLTLLSRIGVRTNHYHFVDDINRVRVWENYSSGESVEIPNNITSSVIINRELALSLYLMQPLPANGRFSLIAGIDIGYTYSSIDHREHLIGTGMYYDNTHTLQYRQETLEVKVDMLSKLNTFTPNIALGIVWSTTFRGKKYDVMPTLNYGTMEVFTENGYGLTTRRLWDLSINYYL